MRTDETELDDGRRVRSTPGGGRDRLQPGHQRPADDIRSTGPDYTAACRRLPRCVDLREGRSRDVRGQWTAGVGSEHADTRRDDVLAQCVSHARIRVDIVRRTAARQGPRNLECHNRTERRNLGHPVRRKTDGTPVSTVARAPRAVLRIRRVLRRGRRWDNRMPRRRPRLCSYPNIDSAVLMRDTPRQ